MSDRLQAATSGRDPKAGKGWFSGRARRREYWLWVGPLFVLVFMLGAAGQAALGMLASLPILFIWIRRLHDLGHSGWFAPVLNIGSNVLGFGLMAALPGGVGALLALLLYLVLIIGMGVIPGQAQANEYGAPSGKPKVYAETFN